MFLLVASGLEFELEMFWCNLGISGLRYFQVCVERWCFEVFEMLHKSAGFGF